MSRFQYPNAQQECFSKYVRKRERDETVIHGYIKSKETNESINNDYTDRVKTKTWPKRTCLVMGDSMLEHIDETRMSRKFKVKVRPFSGAKTEDMLDYLVPLPEKMSDYVILHVGTNNAIDYEASDIVKKIIQVKKFIKLRVPNSKVIISKPIKRHNNDSASGVIDEVISQFEKLTIDMIGNEKIEKKQLEKRGLRLRGFGLKNLLRI